MKEDFSKFSENEGEYHFGKKKEKLQKFSKNEGDFHFGKNEGDFRKMEGEMKEMATLSSMEVLKQL